MQNNEYLDVFSGPDQGPKCSLRLSTDDTSRQRVKGEKNTSKKSIPVFTLKLPAILNDFSLSHIKWDGRFLWF